MILPQSGSDIQWLADCCRVPARMALLVKPGCHKGSPYTFREPCHLNRKAALDIRAGRLGLYVAAMLNVHRAYGLSPQWMHTVPNPRRW